jgi:hypothetical protein
MFNAEALIGYLIVSGLSIIGYNLSTKEWQQQRINKLYDKRLKDLNVRTAEREALLAKHEEERKQKWVNEEIMKLRDSLKRQQENATYLNDKLKAAEQRHDNFLKTINEGTPVKDIRYFHVGYVIEPIGVLSDQDAVNRGYLLYDLSKKENALAVEVLIAFENYSTIKGHSIELLISVTKEGRFATKLNTGGKSNFETELIARELENFISDLKNNRSITALSSHINDQNQDIIDNLRFQISELDRKLNLAESKSRDLEKVQNKLFEVLRIAVQPPTINNNIVLKISSTDQYELERKIQDIKSLLQTEAQTNTIVAEKLDRILSSMKIDLKPELEKGKVEKWISNLVEVASGLNFGKETYDTVVALKDKLNSLLQIFP